MCFDKVNIYNKHGSVHRVTSFSAAIKVGFPFLSLVTLHCGFPKGILRAECQSQLFVCGLLSCGLEDSSKRICLLTCFFLVH